MFFLELIIVNWSIIPPFNPIKSYSTSREIDSISSLLRFKLFNWSIPFIKPQIRDEDELIPLPRGRFPSIKQLKFSSSTFLFFDIEIKEPTS